MGFFHRSASTVEVGPAKPGETAPRRNIHAKDHAWTTPDDVPGVDTIYKLFKKNVELYDTRYAMASRVIKTIHTEEKMVTKKIDGKDQKVPKKWQYYELTPYHNITYRELDTLVSNIASGLVKLGVKPNGEERFHIYAQTCAEWLQTALACSSQGIPVVTAYDTLGEEGLTHSMVETETVGVLVDGANLHTLLRPLKKATKIKYIIYRQDIEDANYDKDIEELKALREDIQVLRFEDLVALGKANSIPASPPSPEDTALIMYTSGSTGTPKGVILLQKTVVGGVAGVAGNIDHKTICPGDKVLAFLPLAHIFEFTLELGCIHWGATLGYANPKTLSDVSVKNCLGDIREYKPDIMVGVPTVWENVRKGILSKIKENPSIVQKIFWAAYYAKLGLSHYGIPVPLVDTLIFKKVKDATGGNVKFVMNGGAALSKDTQVFISTLIAPLLIGYGLTETNANCSLMSPRNFEFGTQGELTHGVTVKLVDVPDAGYFAKNNQGEVFIKGNPVSPQYFKNEKETKDAFTEDGWFMTGDIGEWTPSGSLKLIDRKKNLVKTLHGEYIALEKLESTYRSNPYVANICVYADSSHVKPIAIIVPAEKAIHELCSDKKIDIHEDVAQDPRITSVIHKSILETGKAAGLSGVELLAGIVISPIEWTPQNGYVTSAQKLQRKKILEANKKAVEDVFKRND
ncbi:long-chain fatty acid-CoA ligase FAA4 [Sugiyamaella lignohabitans]|uniref:Long-chain fatty acid-CoA ligase FAA4 n=1 Tax=Sugiyamaella lignohabitans TaxID=796027 RepID=A0A167DXV9_9ASCO|nr:long-chain fatty acid-CoA ligase FAA4 [Sugiyamaella lignohabitans]ANB13426.1 long-chain fatty acid-CoA ligase FAA4 [Sugiyamaella lignohabitans]